MLWMSHDSYQNYSHVKTSFHFLTNSSKVQLIYIVLDLAMSRAQVNFSFVCKLQPAGCLIVYTFSILIGKNLIHRN